MFMAQWPNMVRLVNRVTDYPHLSTLFLYRNLIILIALASLVVPVISVNF